MAEQQNDIVPHCEKTLLYQIDHISREKSLENHVDISIFQSETISTNDTWVEIPRNEILRARSN